MKLVKKILIAHADAALKRRLVLCLADQGYDLRAYSDAVSAVDAARGEWFDLALIDASLSEAGDFALAGDLKRVQPTMPIVGLVYSLELSVIVRGIRAGLVDVLEEDDDLMPLLQRVHLLLSADAPLPEAPPTAAELAGVDALLARQASATDAPAAGEGLGLLRECARLETEVKRLSHEKTALALELKQLATQNQDAVQLQAERAELAVEREIVVATQAAIDEKARTLAAVRAEIVRERAGLESARLLAKAGAGSDEEREHLEKERTVLREELETLKAGIGCLRDDAVRAAQERCRWREDLELLREQESNLREYEARLRKMQAQLESERVAQASQTKPASASPFEDPTLRAAWEKIHRATELLEAERTIFNDEKLAVRDQGMALKKREERLHGLEARLAEKERKLHEAPPAPVPVIAPVAAPAPAAATGGGGFRALTSAPFAAAKSLLTRS